MEETKAPKKKKVYRISISAKKHVKVVLRRNRVLLKKLSKM